MRPSEAHVRQQIIRMLMHDYCIPRKDIAIDFAIRIKGRQRTIDIAIFDRGEPHREGSLRRIVVCSSDRGHAAKNTTILRDFSQAEKDLQELKMLMAEIPSCKYGLWTNGLENFFLEKQASTLEIQINPISDWPPSKATSLEQNTFPKVYAHEADPGLLRLTIQRCKILLHDNEGMPANLMFWQLFYLFFCKVYDESVEPGKCRFWVSLTERFEAAGQRQIRKRMLSLFQDVKKNYRAIFRGGEEITLSDRALAFIVSELARYNFAESSLDAKEAAFQEIAEIILRTDRGQYLTPWYIVQFLVAMLAPGEQERVFDPACGTGGLLVETQRYISEKNVQKTDISSSKGDTVQLKPFNACTFGADIDSLLIRVARMQLALLGCGEENLYQMNSLAFPYESLVDTERARSDLRFGTFDVLVTNPPFSSIVPIDDKNTLGQFEMAHIWREGDEGGFIKTGDLHKSVPVEILFIERSLQWLKPGGRLGIVLPTTILSSPLYEYARWWILQKAWVLAIVDLPAEAFMAAANVKILTSLFFLQKKTTEEIRQEMLQGEIEYPVFVALAESIGIDSRGNELYRSQSDNEKLRTEENVKRELLSEKKVLDNDLPVIVQEYKEFLNQQVNSNNLPYSARKG